ncbi:carboxypeptidase-like regulatory domain-containing protein [Micromonospora yasonensis]|uniref:MSCRAMM family protein n=1 Tax=Micromonospora yasonensis TaxID=1128667 RepID=UPI002230413C|nr:carboxypeptidase-like regulatory domain-containing protein [Micromonospora yasonensis]MCW3845228.1 carboxypeptidase-like regulatory domain-containing protein [Micromonospora yasonensis]
MRLSKRWTRALAAAAVVAAVLASAPAAQAQTAYTLTGAVTDRATGAPLPGACLTLFNAPDKPIATRCADEQGHYTFSGLTYVIPARLRAQAAGHADLWWPSDPDYDNALSIRYPATGTTIEANLALLTSVGGFAGRITQPDGSPAYDSDVTAVAVGGAYWAAKAATDGDGRYRLGNLPPGAYQLMIGPRGMAPTQWLPGTGDPPVATVYEVAPDATASVDGQYLTRTSNTEGGVLTGTVTAAATGLPVAGACVTAVAAWNGQDAATACTDATGRYRITTVSINPGYKLRIRADGYPEQWAPNATNRLNASIYHPVSGLIINVALRLGGGTLRGQVTDYPGATPALTTSVRAEAVNGSWSAWTQVVDGQYQLDRVPPGDYRISIKPLDRTVQYHPGKATPTEATIVHVADGEVTTVDEQLVPPGVIEVTLRDSVTGAPVTGCVNMINAQDSLCGTGTITFTKAWATGAKPEQLLIQARPSHWTKTISSVPVVSGETTRITAALEPGAVLETTVIDAKDGSVPGRTCVYPVSARKLVTTAMRRDAVVSWCSDTTGKLKIGPLPAGPVQLMVVPPAPYGAQWYTENGGTGDRRIAKVYSMRAGQSVIAPPIRLDPAGTLIGRVTDQYGSTAYTCVNPFGQHPDLDPVPLRACISSTSNPSGSYRFDNLGPYRWPLGTAGNAETSAGLLAPGWSGNATNRFDASLVQITAGATTTAPDITLPRGALIRRLDTGSAGSSDDKFEVYQATTGDRVVSPLTVQGVARTPLPAGPLLLRLLPLGGTPCWYVGPSSGPRRPRSLGPTPINLTPGQVIDTLRLVPGDTCKPVPTDIRIGPAMLTPTR